MSVGRGLDTLRDAEELRRLYYEKGLTQAEIAARVDVSRKDVSDAMNRFGIAPGQGGSYPSVRSLLTADPADVGDRFEDVVTDPRPDMAPLADLADAHGEDPQRARALLESVDEHRAVLYDALREHGEQSMTEIQERYVERVDSPRSQTWVRVCLAGLASLGVVKRRGATSSRTYRLAGGDRDAGH